MRLRKELEDIISVCGAVACGVVSAGPVSAEALETYDSWIAAGRHAGMAYMSNYREVRADSRRLLEGARAMISCAFSFAPPEERGASLPRIASYALGDDYHDVLRRRLSEAVEQLRQAAGGEWRICIDTAPVMERYWAVEAGIAERTANGCVAVPGHGSMVFLAELVTTVAPEDLVAPDRQSLKDLKDLKDPKDLKNSKVLKDPKDNRCHNCHECPSSKLLINNSKLLIEGSCRQACPGRAIREDGTIDARRCISYLSIEHRGDWDETGKEVMNTPAGRHTLYGCDICLRSCPLNRQLPPTNIKEFHLRESLRNLSSDDIKNMDQPAFSRLFKGSAIKRAKLAGLRRNSRS